MAKVNGVEFILQPLPDSKKSLKSPYPMEAKGYTLHNTYNDATAANEIRYMQHTNPKSTSYHYAIDDKYVIQGLDLNRNGWHGGDGKNGFGNRNTWGVEICYSKSGGDKYDKAEDNAILFVAQGLYDNGWDISKVWKHQDWSGKNCPHRILARSRGWEGIIAEIQKELDRLKGKKTPSPSKPSKPKPTLDISKKSVDTLARETIAGKYKSGDERKKLLGNRYSSVQKRVNELLSGGKKKNPAQVKSVESLARETIDGKWKSGDERKKLLGSRYSAVQKRVNEILLGGKKSKPRKSINTLINEVNRGIHGNGEKRKKSLGADYDRVQKEINRRAGIK